MSADSSRSGEGSRGSTEHDYHVFLSFSGSDPIAQSKISIPTLSENYAASKWCLRELVQMMENGKSSGRGVMPIFEGVGPSHGRNLRGSFERAFRSHKMFFEQRDVEAGQRELRDVSFLKGWESEKIARGYVISSPSKLVDFLSMGSCCCNPKLLIGRIEI